MIEYHTSIGVALLTKVADGAFDIARQDDPQDDDTQRPIARNIPLPMDPQQAACVITGVLSAFNAGVESGKVKGRIEQSFAIRNALGCAFIPKE